MQNAPKFSPKIHQAENIFAALTAPETTQENIAKTIIRISRRAAPLHAKAGTYPTAEEEQIIMQAKLDHPENESLTHAIYLIYRYYVMTTANGFYRAIVKKPLSTRQRIRDFEEMESTVYPDFMSAVSRYEVNLGFRLMTFCRSQIFASVQNYCNYSGLKRQRRSHRAEHITQCYMHQISNNLSHAEAIALTASRLNLDISEVESCILSETHQANLTNPISISTPIPGLDKDVTVGDTIPDENSPDILDVITSQEDQASVRLAIKTVLANMSERDSHIFHSRLQGDETLEALAKNYNISRERVRQIEAKIMGKLTTALSEQRGNAETIRVSLAA